MSNQDMHELALEVFNTVREELDDHQMRYQVDENKLTITMISVGEDLPMPVFIEVIADRQVLRILSPIPAKMPEDKRIEGAVATANYGLLNGSFDYDMEDGGIRFRATTGYHGTRLSKDLIHYMIAIVLSTVEKYDGRFFVLAKGMSSLEDFLKAEEK